MNKRLNLNIYREDKFDFDKSKFLRLDANERIIPYSKSELAKIKKIITSDVLQTYPTLRSDLILKISKRLKINKDFVNIMPGIDLVLKYLFEIFTKENGKILSIYPTYGLIDVYAELYNLKIKKIKEDELENFCVLKNYKNISMVYLANPNSPSGLEIPSKIIKKICEITKRKKIIFICDETYIDYSNINSSKELLKTYPNLIVLRTFSKFIGLAGIRLSYILSNKKNIDLINKVRPPHDVSSLSIKIAKSFFNSQIEKKYLSEIQKSINFIIKFCKLKNLRISLKGGNFFHIFFDTDTIKKVSSFLKKKNILVKSSFAKDYGAPYKGYSNSIRVTIGSKKQMIFFFKNLLDGINKK